MKTRDIIKEFIIITVATAIVAAAVFFFLIPSHVSVGSISGLAIVLGNFVPLPISVITMIMNVALLILGFLSIGREFGGKTVYASILLPVTIGILEMIFPNNTSMTAVSFLALISKRGSVLFPRRRKRSGSLFCISCTAVRRFMRR